MDEGARLNVLGLCSGVGGIELGLHRTGGFRTVCYVEKDPWCVATTISRIRDGLLCDAPIWTELETFDGRPWRGVVDCIASGFPCQPVSVAGKQLGEEDERWIWPEIIRIICEVRPRIVLLENVPGLLVRGLGRVLGNLAANGYSSEWASFSAAAVGSCHVRDRVFIASHPKFEGSESDVCNVSIFGEKKGFIPRFLDSDCDSIEKLEERLGEPSVRGSNDGVPNRVDRLRTLGNAVVPQVAEVVGRMIKRRGAYG